MNQEEWKKKPLRLVEKKGLREPMIKLNRIGVNDSNTRFLIFITFNIPEDAGSYSDAQRKHFLDFYQLNLILI